MRITLPLIFLFVLCPAMIFIVGCHKDEGTTVIQTGLNIEPFEKNKLNAYPIIGYLKTGSPLYPDMDGDAKDAIWSLTEAYEIQTTANQSGFAPTVTLRALYDSYYLFILASWQDTSKSNQKNVWWFGGPNSGDTTDVSSKKYSWKQITQPYHGTLASLQKMRVDTTTTPPDTHYVYEYIPIEFSGDEDCFAMMFNVNSTNFLNCSNLCHGDNMKTDTDEKADIWEWGATRTDPKKAGDDRSLTDQGFQPDAGTPVFELNTVDGHPHFAAATDPGANVPVLVDSNAFLFYPQVSWLGGNRIPGYVMQTPVGSRGDIMVRSRHKEGVWTLEIRRDLNTLIEDGSDVIFNPDKDANLEFHVAVYDNSHGANHATSTGVHLLHFLQYNEKKSQ